MLKFVVFKAAAVNIKKDAVPISVISVVICKQANYPIVLSDSFHGEHDPPCDEWLANVIVMNSCAN